MAFRKIQGSTPDSPQSAGNFISRSAEAIRARGKGVSQYRAEYQALIQWAGLRNALLPFDYTNRYKVIGSGAEHRVYYDESRSLAIKATHTNRFGYSTLQEGKGASPLEYLSRLRFQNLIFGDDIKIVGVSHEDGQLELVTSQPWITADRKNPTPTKIETDEYFAAFGFASISDDPTLAIYYGERFDLVVADAHNQNILRDKDGNLSVIDVVIGAPGRQLNKLIEKHLPWVIALRTSLPPTP